MSSRSRCLYIGVTSDLHGRVWEHKNGVFEGFTKKITLIEKMNPTWEDIALPEAW